jgi:hypothetical protein
LVVSPPAIAPTWPFARDSALAASPSARSQLTARSSPPSRTIGSVMRSSTWTA